DKRAGDFLAAALEHRGLDAVGHLLDQLHRDRPFLTGLLQPRDKLEPIVRFAPAVLLDHHRGDLFDALVSGEAAFATGADAAAANRGGVGGKTRVDNPIGAMTAKRTAHWSGWEQPPGIARLGRCGAPPACACRPPGVDAIPMGES